MIDKFTMLGKNLFLHLILIAGCFLWACFLLNAEESPLLTSGQVIGLVNDDIITSREVARRVMILNTNFRVAVQTLIEDKVLTSQAIKENIKISDEELEETFAERTSYFGSIENFSKAILQPLKMSLEEYRKELKEQLLRDKYIHSKIGSYKLTETTNTDFVIDTFVSPKEIREYLEANREKFMKSERIQTRQIILKITDSRPAVQTKALAEEILIRLKKGDNFESLARQYSDVKTETGGLWDWAEKGSFLPEVEQTIQSLKVGEISPLIATPNSFIIVKIENKITDNPTFDIPEIQEEIRKTLINQKISRGTNLIREKLLKEATIQIRKEEYLKK